jgi:Mg2+/citrate symporter
VFWFQIFLDRYVFFERLIEKVIKMVEDDKKKVGEGRAI